MDEVHHSARKLQRGDESRSPTTNVREKRRRDLLGISSLSMIKVMARLGFNRCVFILSCFPSTH